MSDSRELDLLRIIIAFILPPLAVYLQRGISGSLFINILLTLLGFLPGLIHAVYVVLKYDD